MLLGIATGHPLVGLIVGKVASALAADPATRRLLEAEGQWDDEQARAQTFARQLLVAIRPLLHELAEQTSEQMLQTLRYIERNVASASTQGRVLALLEKLTSSSRPVTVHFEGPGAVPATPVPFFVADEELSTLRRAFAEKISTVVVLPGIGGLGKTTLARELVARHGAALFPAGAVWIDARSLGSELVRVARHFGYSGDREPTVDEARQWLCAALHERDVLLVFDNVDLDRIDLAQLPIPGGRCSTLLTSRDVTVVHKLGTEARSIDLTSWPLSRCRAYLRRAQPSFEAESDGDLDALGEFVGGLPLALRLISVHPSMRRGLTASALLQALRNAPLQVLDRYGMGQYPGIPKGVQQTFEAAFLELDADEQAVFCAVGLCARATRREIVAAVVQLTEEATDVVLNRLADISFVQYAADRQAPWSEHDVLRFFAVSRERKALLEAAHQRWFEEYTTRLAAPTHHEAFAIAVPEGLALVERLLQQKKAVEASRLFFRVFMHLTRQGSFAQALDTGAYVAAHLPDRSEERAAWLCNLGACYRNIGDPHKAIVLLEGSLEIAKLLGARGQGLVAATTGNLGACYMSLEDLPRAIALFRETERLEQDRGNREGQAKALGSLAVCAGKQGNVGEAKALLERALAMTKEEVNKSMLLGNLACCLRLQRHPREALDLHERAWRIDRDIGNVPGQANNLGNMGLCHLDLGETAKAAEELDRAIALFDSTDLAEVHEGIKNFRHALATLRGTAPRAL